MSEPALSQCHSCGTEISSRLLSCPFCQALVHESRLKQLAAEAQQFTDQGDLENALKNWREALTLLPAGSAQADGVVARIGPLTTALTGKESAGNTVSWRKYGSVLGVVALLLWKFKVVLFFVLTKGKLLLLGLTKSTTLFSMLLSLGVYWTVFGWKFALGLVLSIYVHEMGHVFALNRLGIRASAPMFIPGFGAMVRMHEYPASPAEDADVGLAGPVWGLLAAIVCWLVYLAGGGDIWGAIAKVGAWINLFNLVPVWQLDGHRGFRALSRSGRAVMLLLVSASAWYFEEGLMWLIVIAGLFTLRGDAPKSSDAKATFVYVGLIVALGYLTTLQVLAPN